MRPVYNSLSMKTGAINPGIYLVQVAPREWLAADPFIDFNTGVVKTALQFVPGHSLLTFTFTPESYDLDIKPKSNKGGQYDECTLAGILNEIDPTVAQTLETLRYHQFIVVATDRKKQQRVIGNTEVGMSLSPGQKITSATNGGETISLQFYMEGENPAPFYQP